MVATAQSAGWSTTVVTSVPHHPTNVIYPGFERGAVLRREGEHGTVIHVRKRFMGRSNLGLRLVGEMVWAHDVSRVVSRENVTKGLRADVVVATSPYMIMGRSGQTIARRLGANFVWDVRDLTWLYPAATGARTYNVDGWIDDRMRRLAASVDRVITVNDDMARHLGVGDKAEVIPNGVDERFLHVFLGERWTKTSGRRPLIVYAGLLGRAHRLDVLVQAAALMPDTDVVLVGDGTDRARLELLARSIGSPIRFEGHVDTESLVDWYSRATVLVSTISEASVFRTTVPSKLTEMLATGVPSLVAGAGAASDLVVRYGLAATCSSSDGYLVAATIRSLLDDYDDAWERAVRAREWVKEHGTRAVAMTNFMKVLDSLKPGRSRTSLDDTFSRPEIS